MALLQLSPFPWGTLFARPIFSLWEAMFSKGKKYKVYDHAKKAARFFITCQANPDTKAKVTEAVWVKGYSDSKVANSMLQMQVHCMIIKVKGEVSPCPKSAALGPGNCDNDWPCPP